MLSKRRRRNSGKIQKSIKSNKLSSSMFNNMRKNTNMNKWNKKFKKMKETVNSKILCQEFQMKVRV